MRQNNGIKSNLRGGHSEMDPTFYYRAVQAAPVDARLQDGRWNSVTQIERSCEESVICLKQCYLAQFAEVSCRYQAKEDWTEERCVCFL